MSRAASTPARVSAARLASSSAGRESPRSSKSSVAWKCASTSPPKRTNAPGTSTAPASGDSDTPASLSQRSTGASPSGSTTARRCQALTRRLYALTEALTRLAHQRDRFGEDGRHHRADLLRLLLRGALDVHPVDRGDRHVDRQLDRVVGPRQRLRGLHLLGHLLHPPLEVWVVEEAAETFHGLNCTGGRAGGRGARPAGGASGSSPA